jgi:hypothetical protein
MSELVAANHVHKLSRVLLGVRFNPFIYETDQPVVYAEMGSVLGGYPFVLKLSDNIDL